MKPLGRKHNPTAEDVHPPKGFINWWEDNVTPCKKRTRQQAKRDIRKELDEI